MAAIDLLPWFGLAAFIVVVLRLSRVRERRVQRLVQAYGRETTGTITEYSVGEDGYNVSYEFTPEGRSAAVVRTETLPSKPRLVPAIGERIAVTYLPGIPSLSRANFEAYCGGRL